MLFLARNPYAGVPLGDQLVGFRKIVVGNRDWRIVWRVEVLDNGDTLIDIAEVWAVGARSDDEVYDEMVRRVKSLDMAQPESASLAEVVKALVGARQAPDITKRAEPVPAWLRERLVKTAKIDSSIVARMTLQQAVDSWTDFISKSSD
jgi:mRNA interferase RelE/StbE